MRVMWFLSICATVGASHLASTSHAAAPDAQPLRFTSPLQLRQTMSSDIDLGFSIGYRPRFLSHTGKDFVSGDGLNVVTHRARFAADVSFQNWIRTFVQVQDVRLWGEEDNQLDPTANGLDLHQIYVELFAGDFGVLRVGRQEIDLDNKRIISSLPWSQRGISFDGARLMLAYRSLKLQAFGVLLQEDETFPEGNVPDGRTAERHMVGGHANYKWDWLTTSALYVFRIERDLEVERHTVGLFAQGSHPMLQAVAELYYQFGDMASETISAYLASLELKRKVADIGPAGIRASTHATILSGDGTQQGTFDTLYALNHKYYGELDFFLNISRDTQNLGLVDVGGHIGVGLSSIGLDIVAAVNHFRSVERVNGDGVFGTELDFKIKWSLGSHFYLRGVVGVFLPGRLRGSDNELGGFLTMNGQI